MDKHLLNGIVFFLGIKADQIMSQIVQQLEQEYISLLLGADL